MFSRAERTYLSILGEGDRMAAAARLEREFPNPVYRRKLLWSIRQKVQRSIADWELYRDAALANPNLLPKGSGPAEVSRPVFQEPIVGFVDRLLRSLKRRGAPGGSSASPAAQPSR